MAHENFEYSQTAVIEPTELSGADKPRRVGTDSDVVDIHNLEPVPFPSILEQAYTNVGTSPWKRAEMALDMRRAGNMKTAINVGDDDERVEQVCTDFVHELQEKLPTGEIDLPGHLGKTATTAVVVRALIEELAIQDGEVNVDQLLLENAKLEYQLDKYRKVRTVELAAAELDQRDAEIASLQAEVAELRARQPGEVVRAGMRKIKALGSGVARFTVARS